MSEVGERLIAEVRRIAAENPLYVYEPENCQYMEYGEDGSQSPSCIMGRALFNLGYLPTDEYIENKSIGQVQRILGLDLGATEIKWCEAVQAAQDGRVGGGPRRSWGRAVRYAETSSWRCTGS